MIVNRRNTHSCLKEDFLDKTAESNNYQLVPVNMKEDIKGNLTSSEYLPNKKS